ncbi:MAG: uracil-DNA glycosylase [Crocinitomicaceae bacterium]|nr:uracil-DNA glycosylase [Crocinitomicaceae bacterium]
MSTWGEILKSEFEQPYFKELKAYVDEQYVNHVCYPPKEEIFNAFRRCDFDSTRVVIIGQDPYHGKGQAHGLCFSVNDGVKFPPSLQNIFKEIQSDLHIPPPESGNLNRWAEQGVLLLNAVLSVRESEPGSHQKRGWETFTDKVIQMVSEEKEHVVFLLWGAFAISKSALIDQNKHLVLTSTHPSPFSAHKGFLGCGHFSKTNLYLQSKKLEPIKW